MDRSMTKADELVEPWYGDRDPHEVDQAYGDYDGSSCLVCSRERVIVGGATGRRTCEKCGWYQDEALAERARQARTPSAQDDQPVTGGDQ